jgi:CTP synthase
LDKVVCRELKLGVPEPDLREWREIIHKIGARSRTVHIAIVGKYVQLHDAYLSIIESLNHAGFEAGVIVNILWVDSEDVTDDSAGEILSGADGMIIPGGFGDRGIDGKLAACRYAREHDIPFLGICLGMQMAVIEFARNVCGLEGAHSTENDPATPHPVIDYMPGQADMLATGGTMRLGAYPCRVVPGTLFHSLYGTSEISERHRHRFEFNNSYLEDFMQGGLVVCGASPDGNLVEAVELPDKRFFVGVQFHPEFKSRPNRPHPLFLGLVRAAAGGTV